MPKRIQNRIGFGLTPKNKFHNRGPNENPIQISIRGHASNRIHFQSQIQLGSPNPSQTPTQKGGRNRTRSPRADPVKEAQPESEQVGNWGWGGGVASALTYRAWARRAAPWPRAAARVRLRVAAPRAGWVGPARRPSYEGSPPGCGSWPARKPACPSPPRSDPGRGHVSGVRGGLAR